MKKTILNGVVFEREEGTPLKDVLIEYGFGFPCGGNGQCGKCRIQCPEMEITEKDRRFLSETALSDGWRIACDKKVGDFSVSCPPPTRPEKVRELSSCNICAVIGVKTIQIAIVDDEVAETVTVPNPLYGENGLQDLAESVRTDEGACAKKIKAVLNKESIELFEKYGKAKAETFAIATNGVFAGLLVGTDINATTEDYNAIVGESDLGLPTESVYFLPVVNGFIGGDIIAETVNYPEHTMLIDCEEVCTIVSIGKEDNVAFAMWDMQYDEIGKKALKAAILTLKEKDVTPYARLYGEYKEQAESVLLDLDLTFTECEKKMDNCAKVIDGLRYRTKLNKERARTSICDLYKSETFQTFLIS